MSIFRSLKTATAYFLSTLMGNNPAPERLNRALVHLPKVRPLHHYPQPSRRPSGVAAARRAAKKRRKAK